MPYCSLLRGLSGAKTLPLNVVVEKYLLECRVTRVRLLRVALPKIVVFYHIVTFTLIIGLYDFPIQCRFPNVSPSGDRIIKGERVVTPSHQLTHRQSDVVLKARLSGQPP